MYTPSHFAEHRVEVMQQFIREFSLATIITSSHGEWDANHVPVLLDSDRGDLGVLRGHVARANPVWRDGDAKTLVIFSGRDYYVSPSWYPSKQQHGRVVPTWNYTAVHAHGRLTFFEDRARLRRIVDDLTDVHEAGFAQRWRTTDTPDGFIDSLLGAIVGFVLREEQIEHSGRRQRYFLRNNLIRIVKVSHYVFAMPFLSTDLYIQSESGATIEQLATRHRIRRHEVENRIEAARLCFEVQVLMRDFPFELMGKPFRRAASPVVKH